MDERPQDQRGLIGGRSASWTLVMAELPIVQPYDVVDQVKVTSLNRVDLGLLVGAQKEDDARSDYIVGRKAAKSALSPFHEWCLRSSLKSLNLQE